MQFGIFSVSDVTRDPVRDYTPTEAERIDALVRARTTRRWADRWMLFVNRARCSESRL